MTERTNHMPIELSTDEIDHVAGGTGLVGPGAGKDSGGGGTIGSGT